MLNFTVILDYIPVGDGKKIISPNQDKTFRFKQAQCPLSHVHKLFSEFYILSRPLNIKDEIITRRDIECLESLYDIQNNYVVIDLDHVKDVNQIKMYFENNNYHCSLFRSRNNLKGIMIVDFVTSQVNVEALLNLLNEDLLGLCEVDVSSARRASYQSPFLREEVIYINESGYKPKLDDISDYIQSYKKIEDYSDINADWFLNRFMVHYGVIPKSKMNVNGTIQCSTPTEVKTKFSYFWSKDYPWFLVHPNKNKTINIFQEFIKSDEGKKYLKEKKVQDFKNFFNNFDSDMKVNSRYFELTDKVKNFLNKKFDVLCIKGAMGTGKSNIIEYFNKPRTLFISVRRSLSNDIQEKYKCKHYLTDLYTKDKTSYRNGDSLVVQVDSLHRINIKNFDTVIIDEFESMCVYTQNNMIESDNYISNMRILNEIFQKKKIIIADAFLNNFTRDLYFKNRKVISIENEYKDELQVFNYKHSHTFISILEKVIYDRDKDEIVTCSFGTKDEMLALKQMLEEKNIRVIAVSADITDEAKKLANSLFKLDEVKQYDVIMFTPTITVGISIMNKVKHHFHFDKGKSVDVISSIQMTKRSRSAEYVHVYTEGRNTTYKTTDVNFLNEETLNKINRISNLDNIMFNYDSNDISSIGKFINCFVAHKNFYSGNHKIAFDFLITAQFKNIIDVNEKIDNKRFDLTVKGIKLKKKLIFVKPNKYLDIEDYDLNFRKKDINEEEYSYQLCLEIKLNLFKAKVNDQEIIKITSEVINNSSLLRNIKNFLFFMNSPEERKKIVNEITLKSLKNIIVNDNEIKDYSILADVNYDLMEYYTGNEINDLIIRRDNFVQVLRLLGYKKKNNGYVLPKIIAGLL